MSDSCDKYIELFSCEDNEEDNELNSPNSNSDSEVTSNISSFSFSSFFEIYTTQETFSLLFFSKLDLILEDDESLLIFIIDSSSLFIDFSDICVDFLFFSFFFNFSSLLLLFNSVPLLFACKLLFSNFISKSELTLSTRFVFFFLFNSNSWIWKLLSNYNEFYFIDFFFNEC